jgi:hypothetical protein
MQKFIYALEHRRFVLVDNIKTLIVNKIILIYNQTLDLEITKNSIKTFLHYHTILDTKYEFFKKELIRRGYISKP